MLLQAAVASASSDRDPFVHVAPAYFATWPLPILDPPGCDDDGNIGLVCTFQDQRVLLEVHYPWKVLAHPFGIFIV